MRAGRVADFHFDLPAELIAQRPPEVRGGSRMLVLDRATGGLRDDGFAHLGEYLDAGDLVVLNDSRVLPTRLYGVRAGLHTQPGSSAPSGAIEVLLTRQTGAEEWTALVRPARKVLVRERILFYGAEGARTMSEALLSAEVVGGGEFGERTLRLSATPATGLLEILERIGHMPLPPYIERPRGAVDSPEDRERYQTVFAEAPGSAAAPTAGLHFTAETIAGLKARGVQVETITLHVGLGTFQPVRVERVEDIRLHAESYSVPRATLAAVERTRASGGRVLAVGTTVTRTLEHLARQGAAGGFGAGGEMDGPRCGSTSLFLSPGDRFEVVTGLLTNFHLPESTLLMLVSAFAEAGIAAGAPRKKGRQGAEVDGRGRVLAAYAHAVREGYRFYSYGDCMLLL